MTDITQAPATASGHVPDSLSAIDHIMQARAARLKDSIDREAEDDTRHEKFLADFSALCKEQVRPAMEAAIDRLRANGGGGEIEEGHGNSAHPDDPRLTAWMSLEGEISGHPREDRQPYLQLDGESSTQTVQVSEGDMWSGRGAHSGRVGSWDLTELTGDTVTSHLVNILRRATS